MTKITDMTTGRAAGLMLRFALPVVLTNLGQQLYQIVDAAIVGRGVGVDALAAVGCTDWIYWVILWSVQAMTGGFASFVSRFFGKRDHSSLNRAIVISMVLSAVIALVLTAAGVLLARPLLLLLDTPQEILDLAVTYLTTMVAGTLIVTGYNLFGAILRAFGDGRSPLLAMILAALLNVALDLVFVMVLQWGVFGAAAASVLSQLVALLFCLYRMLRIECVRLRFDWNWRLAWEILSFGVPLALQYMIVNLGGMIVQSTVNAQGSSFIAGYTAVNKLYGLLECSAIALGSAFITFASQNYGAGNFKRVRSGVKTAMLLAVSAAAVLMAVVLPLNRILPQIFLDLSEPGAADALDVAGRYLIHMAFGLPVLYLVYVHRSNLQAIGNSSWSLVSGIAEAGIRVLLAKVLFRWIGVQVLFYVEPFAWLMAWLFVLVPYYFYQRRLLRVQ